MKIIQINAIYKYGSTGRTTMEMHEYCLLHGIESYVFCPNISDEDHNIYRIGTAIDHKLHGLWSRISGNQACFSYFATRRVLGMMEKIQPDVVILRNLHSNYINLPMLLKYLAKNDIATIIVLHDCWFFTGHCTHYFSNNCYKWKNECMNCNLMRNDNKSLFFDTSTSMFRMKKKLFNAIPRLAVVGVSDWVTNEAKKSPVFANAKIFQRIYNWIDLKKFHPFDSSSLREKLGINNYFTVLSVAQGWGEAKGLFKIFEVANKMPDVKFVLVGRMAYNGIFPDNVISVGTTSNVQELAQFYSMADVFLVCSVQETFGKVSAEALACGTPVIANNSTANPEIADEKCGLSFNNNDVTEIVSAIENMRSRLQNHDLKEICVQRALNEFDFNKQIKKYLSLFETFANPNKE